MALQLSDDDDNVVIDPFIDQETVVDLYHARLEGGNLDPEKQCAFVKAAKSGDIVALNALLADPLVDPVAWNSHGNSIINIVAKRGHLHVLNRLVEVGVPPDMFDYHEETPLHAAAVQCDFPLAEWAFTHNFDINSVDASGNTPLSDAVHNGHYEMVDFLIKNGADVDLKDKEECSPLHVAVCAWHSDIVELLIENGADPYAIDEGKDTPLSMTYYELENLQKSLAMTPPDALSEIQQLRDSIARCEAIRDFLVKATTVDAASSFSAMEMDD